MGNILEQIIKPQDCVIAFGIPMSREAYNNKTKSTRESDFLNRFPWHDYESIIVNYYDQTIALLDGREDYDLRIIHRTTFNEFVELFRSERRVIILFSHWVRGCIEFFDGLYGTDQIVWEIPGTFAGLIDLCVCRPHGFPAAIKAKAPHCYVRHSIGPSFAPYWLNYYLMLFRNLFEQELTYSGAILQTAQNLLDDGMEPLQEDIL